MKNVYYMKDKLLKIEYLTLFLYSIAIKFFMSMYSIRFSEIFTDNDGAIYYVIGKAIMNGKVLYRDIFDHKTPYIFFANALASLLDKNHLGLFILEITLLFITLIYTYKFLKLFTSKFRSLIGTFVLGILLNIPQITFSYSRTEEYAIAFMMVGLYLFANYYFLYKKESKENIIPMIAIGLMAGLTFMTNIRAIVLFVPFAFVMLIKNIKEKRFAYIIKLFFAGLLGVFLSTLPYIIYMVLTNSAYDAFYAIYIFNLNYFESAMNIKDSIFTTVLAFMQEQIVVYIFTLLSFIALLKLKFDKYLKISIIVSFAIAFYYITFSKRPYPYYLVIFFPYFLSLYFILLELINWYKNKINLKKNVKIANKTKSSNIDNLDTTQPKLVYVALSFVAFLILGILLSNRTLSNRYKNCVFRASRMNQVVEAKFKDKSDVNILSFGFMPEAYVFMHTIPKYKYFMIPNVSYKVDKTPYMAQYEYIIATDPDVIVFKSRGFYDSYPQNYMNQVNWILSTEYSLEDTIRTNDFDGDIFIFSKK